MQEGWSVNLSLLHHGHSLAHHLCSTHVDPLLQLDSPFSGAEHSRNLQRFLDFALTKWTKWTMQL